MVKPVQVVMTQLTKVKSEVKAEKLPEMLRGNWESVIDDARTKCVNLQTEMLQADYKKLEQMQMAAHIVQDVIDSAKVVVRTYKNFA